MNRFSGVNEPPLPKAIFEDDVPFQRGCFVKFPSQWIFGGTESICCVENIESYNSLFQPMLDFQLFPLHFHAMLPLIIVILQLKNDKNPVHMLGKKTLNDLLLSLLAWLLSFIHSTSNPLGDEHGLEGMLFLAHYLANRIISKARLLHNFKRDRFLHNSYFVVGHPTRFMVKPWNPLCLCYQERMSWKWYTMYHHFKRL